jgi:predicted nucleotidyltransferase component of viral defense system
MIIKNILSEKQKILFDTLSSEEWINEFYLAGGTALALHLAHRQSDDFDFFLKGDIKSFDIQKNISDNFKYQILSEDKNTLYLSINDIRVSFISYNFELIDSHISEGYIRIASLKDIASMKLTAISSRGSKKDFIDLFYILKKISLENLFIIFNKKYEDDFLNKYQILKSLIYFNDAEQQPMPLMTDKVTWSEIKFFFEELVKKASNL